MVLAILLEHMHKKFELNRTKIKGGCQSVRKVVTHNSKSDLPLESCLKMQMDTSTGKIVHCTEKNEKKISKGF